MSELTYAQVAKQTAALARDINRSAERIRGYAKAIRDEALDTVRVAEAIGQMNVDKLTIGETRDLARRMDAVAVAAVEYAAAGDATARAATAAHEQNKTSHSGIGEAAARSSVGREIYDVKSGWLAQE
ncbi:hypothetical protein ABZ485_28205 [Streptomyces albogriseolus]|uniref:hypothetical protein n=1 Tax=Streptomyces albogriseolus TaxID=1887 RepID=UPI00345F6BAA